jgi:acetyl-CoA carboxylase biotin carboxylase subunit
MFDKVLIADRRENAIRIIRTCQLLGIHTVAVYSKEDAQSWHVTMADEAYFIGDSRGTKSHLNTEKILYVTKMTNAEAINPGFGLLSGDAKFAQQCEEVGITYIGPSPEVISLMGCKIESRMVMEKAGLPVFLSFSFPPSSNEEAIEAAEQMGYPVVLKDSTGRGCGYNKLARNREELRKAFEEYQNWNQSFRKSKIY